MIRSNMLYIKIDSNGNPQNHPMTGDNLKQVLEVSILDEATLNRHGYAVFERTERPVNGVVTETTDYYMDADGIVRNRIILREFTQEELVDKFIRTNRSFLLARSDWTQTVDAPLSEAKKAEWAAYRQALRDLPSAHPNVQASSDVVWPVEPV